MEYFSGRRERGVAVLATLILAIVVMGVILVPLRQLAGWAKREQLRRSASERILEARFDAYQRLGELPVLAAPHLVRATGLPQTISCDLASSSSRRRSERPMEMKASSPAGARSPGEHCATAIGAG